MYRLLLMALISPTLQLLQFNLTTSYKRQRLSGLTLYLLAHPPFALTGLLRVQAEPYLQQVRQAKA